MPLTATELLEKAAADLASKKATESQAVEQTTVTKAELGTIMLEFKDLMVNEFKSSIEAQIVEIKKAASVPPRGEGEGRKGTATPDAATERENDPVAYIVKKAMDSKGDEDVLDDTDKALIGAMTVAWLTEGLPPLNGNESE